MERILQMIGSLNVGGSQTMLLNLYRNIDRERIQFDFILDHPQERYFADEVESLGGRIYELPGFRGDNAMEIVRAWDGFLSEHKEYKILHSHVRSYASIYLPIAKKHGLKTVIHSHSTSNGTGISSLVKQLLQRPLRNQADVLMACSVESGQWLFGKDVTKRDNFLVLPNAIDTDKFRLPPDVREAYRKELGISHKLVIGHVGRFHPTKNQSFLVDVLKLVREAGEDAVLLLVGDGELRAQVEEKAAATGLSDSVIITGNRRDVPQLLQAMDVFAFPSIWEGLPVTLIEAQAASLPCLVSDSVGQAAHISPLVRRLSIDNAEHWAAAILERPEKRDVRDYIIKAGFDVKQSAQSLTGLYTKLLGELE